LSGQIGRGRRAAEDGLVAQPGDALDNIDGYYQELSRAYGFAILPRADRWNNVNSLRFLIRHLIRLGSDGAGAPMTASGAVPRNTQAATIGSGSTADCREGPAERNGRRFDFFATVTNLCTPRTSHSAFPLNAATEREAAAFE
jgi:hypothetical protein